MGGLKKYHFARAAADLGAHGDNDTLPFAGQEVACKARALVLRSSSEF